MSRKNRARTRDTDPDPVGALASDDNAQRNDATTHDDDDVAFHGLLAHISADATDDTDHSGDYLLWLTDDCPVHSVVVAGIDIPRFIDLHTFACPDCNHRFVPEQQAPPHCPVCARRGSRVAAVVDGRSPSRRARKRVRLTDARLRELRARLDPAREVKRDARGRRLDGPRVIHTPDGELLLAPFVRLARLDDAGGADDPESIMAALERRRRMVRLARAAEKLAADEMPPMAERHRLAAEVRELIAALNLQPLRGDCDE